MVDPQSLPPGAPARHCKLSNYPRCYQWCLCCTRSSSPCACPSSPFSSSTLSSLLSQSLLTSSAYVSLSLLAHRVASSLHPCAHLLQRACFLKPSHRPHYRSLHELYPFLRGRLLACLDRGHARHQAPARPRRLFKSSMDEFPVLLQAQGEISRFRANSGSLQDGQPVATIRSLDARALGTVEFEANLII